jgi:hypothetical protein
MNQDGRPFIENTITENVSKNGVRVTGLTFGVKKDEVLILSYQNRKGRFRVIWSRQYGTPPKFHVALRALDLTQNIWAFDFSGKADECGPTERRAAKRHICGGVVSISHPGTKYLLRGTLADVNCDGCYVEMEKPLNIHDQVFLILNIRGTEIRTAAEVRTADPGMGIGLKFVDMAETDRTRLQALIVRIGYSGSGQIHVGAERRSGKEIREIPDEPEAFERVFEKWRNGDTSSR